MLSQLTQLRSTDIYLIDQLMRGRIQPGMRILDAGSGAGRNLPYFIAQSYDVSAVDQDPEAIALIQQLAHHHPKKNFRCEAIEAMSFPDNSFHFVISNAVLHFARNTTHFNAMLNSMWRTLKPGGILFARLASSIGIEDQIQPLDGQRRYLLPDGSDRYLVDATQLEQLTELLNAQLLDPIKTTLVHNQRSMTTWVIAKNT